MKDLLQQANYAPITIVMCEFGNVVERGFKSQGLIASFWNVQWNNLVLLVVFRGHLDFFILS